MYVILNYILYEIDQSGHSHVRKIHFQMFTGLQK